MADANTDFEKALTANPEKPGVSGDTAGETALNAANGLGFAGETPANNEKWSKATWTALTRMRQSRAPTTAIAIGMALPTGALIEKAPSLSSLAPMQADAPTKLCRRMQKHDRQH